MAGGFGSSALVCPTDQATVLNAVVAKIRAEISGFDNEAVCFISDVPWPSTEVNDDCFITICPKDAGFDDGLTVGGGGYQVLEHAVFQVTYWSKLSTDQLEHSRYATLDASKGVLPLKKLILKCLAGQQLYSDYPTNTRPLLTEVLRPSMAMHTPSRQHSGDPEYASMSLAFIGPFFWDLS